MVAENYAELFVRQRADVTDGCSRQSAGCGGLRTASRLTGSADCESWLAWSVERSRSTPSASPTPTSKVSLKRTCRRCRS